MTLLEFHADLSRVADSLEKIAFLLEKIAFPPAPADVQVHQATLEDLHVVSPEDVANVQSGMAEFAERHGVVPNSPAMIREVVAWAQEQKRIYGDQWEAPKDDEWKIIFANSYAAPAAGPDAEG